MAETYKREKQTNKQMNTLKDLTKETHETEQLTRQMKASPLPKKMAFALLTHT